MQLTTTRFFALIAPVLATSAALAHHHHLSVTTPTGTPGEALQIVAGYYPEEANMYVDATTGVLMEGRVPFEYNLTALFTDGPLAGQHTGEALAYTSDYFAEQGMIDGSDIYYQIVSITPVESPDALFTWGTVDEASGAIIPEGNSGGDSPIAQSLHVGFDAHPHGEFAAVDAVGEYVITIVAWDGNGVFQPSAPVTIHLHSQFVPADLDGNGEVDGADLGILLGAWGTPQADLNGDGVTDGADLGILLGSWS